MLAQRLRRWANIRPSSLGGRLVFAGGVTCSTLSLARSVCGIYPAFSPPSPFCRPRAVSVALPSRRPDPDKNIHM